MTPTERRDAPVSVATLGWLLVVFAGAGIVFVVGGFLVMESSEKRAGPAIWMLAWFTVHGLLGLACLRGWNAVRIGWIALQALFLMWMGYSSAVGGIRGGDTVWYTIPICGIPYGVIAWVILRPPANRFFTRGAG